MGAASAEPRPLRLMLRQPLWEESGGQRLRARELGSRVKVPESPRGPQPGTSPGEREREVKGTHRFTQGLTEASGSRDKHKPHFTTALQRNFQNLLYAPRAASSWLTPVSLTPGSFSSRFLPPVGSQVPGASCACTRPSIKTPESTVLTLSLPQGRGPQAQHLPHLSSLLV